MKNKPNKCKTCKYGDSQCDWCMTDPDGSLNYEPKDDYDPIHAAGGCYCQECKYYSRKPDDSHGQMESFCKKLNRDPTYIRFCGYGERKNGGEESAAD